MISWEYKSTEIKILEVEKGLNALGKDGWEIAHIEFISNIYRILLKRHLDADKPFMVGG